ncbi:hypothetical protein BBA71_06445 [Acetobacter pasteurianus]|nr:hypothetical protein BBA71_06445 [Acetobacter pasteurianus]
MTDEQSAGTPCVADNDLRQIVAGHGRRLDGLEDDVDTLKSGQRSMMDRLISIEAQGQERERNRAQESARTAQQSLHFPSNLQHRTERSRSATALSSKNFCRLRQMRPVHRNPRRMPMLRRQRSNTGLP